MTGYEGPERLAVIAALLGHDPDASRRADEWVRADGTPCPPAEVALIASATDAEWELSAALRGGSGPAAALMAGLLRLAGGTDVAVLLRLGLRERFLPADGAPGVPKADRAAEFADRFGALAMPGLDDGARERASALLAALKAG